MGYNFDIVARTVWPGSKPQTRDIELTEEVTSSRELRAKFSAVPNESLGHCCKIDTASEQHGVDYFDLWTWDGTLERIHHVLYGGCASVRDGRPVRPSLPSTAKAPKGREKGGWLDPQGCSARVRWRIPMDEAKGLVR